jgi:tRNA threonylcarbamoyladenosine biosynthesis protein TsaB
VRVLAVDTTTANGSVALAEDDQVVGEVRLGRQETHSCTLQPAIEFLLGSLSVAARDVDGWAVAHGPGSFTGLRVGISTIQGLALASNRPCITVSALEALAARIAGEAPHLVALMDAYRGEVYAQLFDATLQPLTPAVVEAPEVFLARVPAGAAFAGDAVVAHRGAIEAACPGAILPERGPFLASAVARLAVARLRAGGGIAPDALRPLYLREVAIRKASR